MNQAILRGQKIDVPGSMGEVSTRQFTELLRVIHGHQLLTRSRLQALLILLPDHQKLLLSLHEEQIAELLPLTDWLFDGSQKWTRQLLPRLKLKGQVLIGPDDELGHLSFGEFIVAERACNTFLRLETMAQQYSFQGQKSLYEGHKEKAFTYLHRLIAVLYRPAKPKLVQALERYRLFGYKPSQDLREPFSDATLSDRSELVVHLPYETQLAILRYYLDCRELIYDRNPKVFKRSEEGKVNPYAWEDALIEMAGDLTNVEEMEQVLLGNVLFDINRNIRKFDELEHQRESGVLPSVND